MDGDIIGLKPSVQEENILTPATNQRSSDEIDLVLRCVTSDMNSSVTPVVEAKIHCLPVEVLGKIMIDCEPVYDVFRSGGSGPVQLGRICRSWREISLSIPALWSLFALEVAGYGDGFHHSRTWGPVVQEQIAKCLRLHLTRSRDAPLAVVVCLEHEPYDGVKHLLNEFAQHSSRWRFLRLQTLECDSSWLNSHIRSLPSLEFVAFNEETIYLEDIEMAPRLHSVEVHNFNHDTITRRLPWAQITTLVLLGDAPDLPALLKLCPKVRNVSIAHDPEFGGFDSLEPYDDPPMVLSHCARFEMVLFQSLYSWEKDDTLDNDDDLRDFFGSFSVPAAQSIVLCDKQSVPQPLPIKYVAPFLENTRTLKELVLEGAVLDRRGYHTGETHLMAILKSVPKLVTLVIGVPRFPRESKEQSKDLFQHHHSFMDALLQTIHPQLHGQLLVPRLQSLEIGGVDISVWRLRWKDMYSALRFRRRGNVFIEEEEMPGLQRLTIQVVASRKARRFQAKIQEVAKRDIDITVRLDEDPDYQESAVSEESDDAGFELEDFSGGKD
ncbi:hypothetical protein Hypma_007269 [Hypsizygus marmoreus]|uniref:F-box domain-containing protein n=1 Tax=Hypsizygus marmoreus TaxID=39966 RepID=A0A369KEU7_HYPMA|nr:hypothetical protein Hypma_007269 [Hypsizygus marmoreus]